MDAPESKTKKAKVDESSSWLSLFSELCPIPSTPPQRHQYVASERYVPFRFWFAGPAEWEKLW